jgi:tetratricopeptide (TPR) repeat protein
MTTLNIPQTLQDRLRERKVIPFVGAGVSMAVRNKHTNQPLFPSWKQLLLLAADRLDNEVKHNEASVIRALLNVNRPDYLYAAKQARDGLNAAWYKFLEHHIDVSYDEVTDESLALAQAIWRLNSLLVITTNYDRVLRWACPTRDYQEWDIEAPAEQVQFLQQNIRKLTIWHLHGQIGNKRNLILTPDGYQRLYSDEETERKHGSALATLHSSFAGYSFLFIGFSLDDEHFAKQFAAVNDLYEKSTGPHFAIVKESQVSGFEQSHPEVRAIPFSDFGESLVELINTLSSFATQTKASEPDAPEAPPPETISVVTSTSHYSLDNPVFFVPYRQKGDQVIGREGALEQVRNQLTQGRRTAIGQAASFHGLGGLGKTQLAVEYAYAYRDNYPGGVIWITADQDIESQLTKLSDEAKWLAPSSEPKQKQDAARHRLRSRSDCLLIFDNLERFDTIEPYLPDLQANPHILVTSRLEFGEFPAVPLNPLSDGNAYQMLVQEAGRKPETADAEEAARNIAQALGGLPLALEIAGAYLARPDTEWEKYYALLQHNPRAVLKGKLPSSFTKHEADLYNTLKISDVIFEEEPVLRDIVDLLTWSGSASMNPSLMCAVLGFRHEAELTRALDLGVSLRLLVKSPKGEGYALHRLVSQVRREEIPLEQRQVWVNDVCQRLGDWFQPIREDFSQLAAYEAQLDHLRAWQQNASQQATQHASRLLWLQAYPSYHRGRYREIKELVAKALQVFVDSKCEDRGLEAHLHNDLGFVFSSLGEKGKALECVERALEIRQKVYGEEHPDTARSLNNVGVSYSDLGEHRKALAYAERALGICQKIFREGHSETARSLNTVGSSYGGLGDYRKALKYKERALEIRQTLYGEEHPETASSLNNVGGSHLELGEHLKALEYAELALAIRQKVYGEEHPETARSLNNVGSSYGGLGDHHKALEYYERALAIYQKVYGEGHLDTALPLYNIGSSFGALGEHRKDLDYTENALLIRKKTLGEFDPETISMVIGKL